MTRTCRIRIATATLLAAAIVMSAAPPEAAAQTVWSGLGAGNSWGTAANWVGGVAPTGGTATFLRFDGTAATFIPGNPAAFQLNRIDLPSTTSYMGAAVSAREIPYRGPGQ